MPEASRQLFTLRSGSYVRFIRFVLYPQGVHGYFLRSSLVRSGLRVLDAGCGTGVVILGFRQAVLGRGFSLGTLHAFDLTPTMLARFRQELQEQGIGGVEVAQADVLRLDLLPDTWQDYDLILSAAMLEYIPPDRLVAALRGLRALLAKDGHLVLFITRQNRLMQWLIGRWWRANIYRASELEQAFKQAGFSNVRFGTFPLLFRHLSLWGHIVEASF